MSVKPTELRAYGSASMSDGEGTTQGGAVSFSTRISFFDITPNGTVNYISSSASDTATTLACTGRDATGVLQTETKTLTGTTAVSGAQTFERLEKVVMGGTTAVGDTAVVSNTAVVAAHTMQTGAAQSTGTTPAIAKLQASDGASVAAGEIIRITSGTGSGQIRQIQTVNPGSLGADFVSVDRDWGTLPDATSVYSVYQGFYLPISPNACTQVRRLFPSAAADIAGGSTRIFYEKIFFVNDDTATACTSASIIKQTDPGSGTIDIALFSALNDTATTVNRQTAPTGITAYTSGAAPQTIAVPSPQNLPSGAAPNSAGAQGVSVRLTLTAGLAPAKGSFTLRAIGSTT
jgi:hypothetical protein